MALSLLEGLCRAEFEAIAKLPLSVSQQELKVGAGGDRTKMVDQIAEEAAISFLKSSCFQGRLLSEEAGEVNFGSADYPMIVLDPVDGTTNASRGISFYCISAAISSGPRLSDVYAGAVMELPSGKVFTAEKGNGAYLDGVKITCKVANSLKQGLIGVDLNVHGNKSKLEQMIPLCLHVKHLRNMGSAALELCYVASGALDLYADNRCLLRTTDIAAARIILLEAGASLLDLDGNALQCRLDLKERVSLVAGHIDSCKEALSFMRRI